jgi:hypothetical protein
VDDGDVHAARLLHQARSVGDHPLAGRLGELREHRSLAEHRLLALLRHHRRVGGVDERSQIDRQERS